MSSVNPLASFTHLAGNDGIAYTAVEHLLWECLMATLSIRNFADDDHKALRLRAAHRGVSMEAEARAILRQVLREQPGTGSVRRSPPKSIAGKGKTLGDLVGPLMDETDWECLK